MKSTNKHHKIITVDRSIAKYNCPWCNYDLPPQIVLLVNEKVPFFFAYRCCVCRTLSRIIKDPLKNLVFNLRRI